MSNKICRICVEKRKDLIELFAEADASKAVLNTVYLCFQIVLKSEENLPSVICTFCKQDLDAAYKFRANCILSTERIKRILKEKVDASTQVLGDVSDEGVQHGVIETNTKQLISLQCKKQVRLKSTHLNIQKTEMMICDVCKKTFNNRTNLQNHVISHKNFNCKMDATNEPRNQNILTSKGQKKTQIKEITNISPELSMDLSNFKRKRNDKVYSRKATLNNKQFKCSECSYNTQYKQTFVNHMRRHNGERPYNCECGKSFTQLSSLKYHQNSLHSNLKQYTCPQCGKQFKLENTLKKHLNVHKVGEFICDICKKTLKTKTSLKEHINRHKKIFDFSCEDCGSMFVTASELTNHKKRHLGFKVFECVCGMKTHSKKHLTQHMKRHTGERTHSCQLCEKSFFSKGELREHLLCHTKDKQFPCPVCKQKFKHSSSRLSHLKSMHNVNYLTSSR